MDGSLPFLWFSSCLAISLGQPLPTHTTRTWGPVSLQDAPPRVVCPTALDYGTGEARRGSFVIVLSWALFLPLSSKATGGISVRGCGCVCVCVCLGGRAFWCDLCGSLVRGQHSI